MRVTRCPIDITGERAPGLPSLHCGMCVEECLCHRRQLDRANRRTGAAPSLDALSHCGRRARRHAAPRIRRGHADRPVPRLRQRSKRQRLATQRLRQPSYVANIAREQPDGIDRPRKAFEPGRRQQTEARLETNDAAVRGRADRRAAGLRADGPRHQPRRDRRRGPGRRATGCAAGRVRIAGGGRLEVGEFGSGRLSDDDTASAANDADDGGVAARRREAGVQRRTISRRQVAGVEDVLDRNRQSGERPHSVRCLVDRESGLGDAGESADRGIVLRDGGLCLLHGIGRRQFASRHLGQGGERGGAGPDR